MAGDSIAVGGVGCIESEAEDGKSGGANYLAVEIDLELTRKKKSSDHAPAPEMQ